MDYLDRDLFWEVIRWVDRPEIIAIKGPRQSGKTTLLEMVKQYLVNSRAVPEANITSITFEDLALRDAFLINPKRFIQRYFAKGARNFIMIDEAQYCPDLGQKLKLLYDTFRDLKIFITGSSSLEITSETSKYLVGRLFSFELLPFNFGEFLHARDPKLAQLFQEQNEQVRKFILTGDELAIPSNDAFIPDLQDHLEEYLRFGGYPEVVKAAAEDEKQIILKNIFNTYLEKDILSFLQITDTVKFRQLVTALSAMLGGMLSYEKLSASTGSYFKEMEYLLDVLTQTYVIRTISPYHQNLVTELRKRPKVYFYDFGLRNQAISNFNPMNLRQDAGVLAENFGLNELAPSGTTPHYWRTTAKAEVDLVLDNATRLVPVEFKYESMKRTNITRSFRSFLDTYQPEAGAVITKDFWGERVVENTCVKFIPLVYL